MRTPADGNSPAINGDHDPADYATCPRCRHETFQGTIPTAGGMVIVYVCDACDATGPRIFIPHLERFERRAVDNPFADPNLHGLLRLVKGSGPTLTEM
jgi:hypothetical protein